VEGGGECLGDGPGGNFGGVCDALAGIIAPTPRAAIARNWGCGRDRPAPAGGPATGGAPVALA